MKFVKGRFLLASSRLKDMYSSQNKPPRVRKPDPCSLLGKDPFGRPMPSDRVYVVIEGIRRLRESEKIKYGFLFSEMLGLPNPPPKISTEGVNEEKFAVKLVKFDSEQEMPLLREVAWIKSTEEVRSLPDLGLLPSLEVLENAPSVITQGVTKEEAEKIIVKIQEAGGVAVMESMTE